MQKHVVQLVDDLDGSKAAETVHFGFGGTDYEIELSARNARAFRKVVGGYIPHARTAGSTPRRTRASRAGRAATQRRNGDIRAWAKDHGITVNERGRIPAAVIARYNANN